MTINRKTARNIVVGALLLGGALTACSEPEVVTTRSLSTVSANQGEIRRVIGATGKVVPRDEIMVGSEVSGRILEVLVDFNSEVKEGDVLARIDPTSYESRVNQIESRIESAKADIQVQKASIESAQVTLSNAEQQMTRRQGLYQQEAISEAQLESAQRDVGVARANMKLAEARMLSNEASVRQLRAQLAEARADLDRTIIISPIDGVVIDRMIDPGQTVQANFEAPKMFQLAADMSQIQVEASVVESDVAGLEAGDTARFTVDAYPDDPVEGVVEQLRLKSTEQNNIISYTAVIAAENPGGRLMPGMTANLQITTETKRGVTRLPVSAERFRPAPEDIAEFEVTSETAEEVSLLEPTYARLRGLGIPDGRLASFKTEMEASTAKFQDAINDPTQPWMHARMRGQMTDLVEAQIKTFLSADEFQAYNELVAQERTIRPVELWVADGAGKMRKATVRLGLSDGSFVEVVDGLTESDKVVIGFTEGGPPPKAQGQPVGASAASK